MLLVRQMKVLDSKSWASWFGFPSFHFSSEKLKRQSRDTKTLQLQDLQPNRSSKGQEKEIP